MTERFAGACDGARARPLHGVLFAAVAGLLLTRAPTAALLAAAFVFAAFYAPTRWSLLAAGALIAAAGFGQHRLDAVHPPLPPQLVGKQITATALLAEAPRRRGVQASARARLADGPLEGRSVVLRWSAPPEEALAVGATLEVRGHVAPLTRWEDFQRWRGAVAAVDVARHSASDGHRGGLNGALDGIRDASRVGLRAELPPATAALLQGMVIGEDHGVPEQVRADFERSGLAHLLAVSGQNVMLLAALIMGVCALLGVPLRVRLFLALATVALYVPVAGAGPSIQRAGVMGAAGLIAVLAGRPASSWYALGLAALVTLGLNPEAVREPGWQLSFAAVIGLIVAGRPTAHWLARVGCPRALADVTAITVVASLATAPLLAHHFGEVSVVSLPANVAAAPAVAPLMWLGMSAAGLAQIHPELAQPLATVSGTLAGYVGWVASTFGDPSYAVVAVPRTDWASVAAAYGVLAAAGVAVMIVVKRCRPAPVRVGSPERAVAVAAVLGAGAVLWLVGARDDPFAPTGKQLLVQFLDVGQGDATLLRTAGVSVLVDTGRADGPILERLVAAGVERLDVLVVTHAQDDHEGAAPAVIRTLRPPLVVNGGAGWPSPVQDELAATAHDAGGRLVEMGAGETLRLGDLEIAALWPAAGPGAAAPTDGDPNETALVLHARHGDFDLLLPADAESEVLSPLELPRVEALKVSHHGSEDPGLPALLERLDPALGVIMVGKDNSYGHPHPDTMRALAGVPRVARTDRDGDVSVLVDRGRMRVLAP